MSRKNNLDERQEQALLRIEHNGCWLAFWGLLIAMAVQMIMNGAEQSYTVAGEWVVFMVLAIYMVGACLKNGIWDRRLKPNTTTNLVVSLIAGVATGVFNAIMIVCKYPDKPVASIAAGIFMSVFVFVPCFVLLQISVKILKKKQQKLEEEPDDDKLE